MANFNLGVNVLILFRKDSDFALNQAKNNLMQHYSVVGTTDHLYDFTRVLQYKFPIYFKGLPELFNKTGGYYLGTTSVNNSITSRL